jgi:hypothetical protein
MAGASNAAPLRPETSRWWHCLRASSSNTKRREARGGELLLALPDRDGALESIHPPHKERRVACVQPELVDNLGFSQHVRQYSPKDKLSKSTSEKSRLRRQRSGVRPTIEATIDRQLDVLQPEQDFHEEVEHV